MADKNIQMTQRNAANTDWDNIFPITKVENVIGAAKKQQDQWTFAALQNNWGNLDGIVYGTASYRKDEFGIVHLVGVLSGGITTDATTMFTLPVGYRPIKTKIFPTISEGSAARIDVTFDGRVQIYGGKVGYVTLNGISYSTDS